MIVILAGILVTILGYKLNRDGEITAKDTAVFVGYFLVMAGILLLSNGIIRHLFKTAAVHYTESERARRIAFAALFAALSYGNNIESHPTDGGNQCGAHVFFRTLCAAYMEYCVGDETDNKSDAQFQEEGFWCAGYIPGCEIRECKTDRTR